MRPPRLPRNRLLSVEEYLRFEEQSSVRHEYVAGRVYAMAGVTLLHDAIVNNVYDVVRPRARRAGCAVHTRDVKVRVDDRVYYPDLFVRCGGRLPPDTTVVEDPSLIVEVLSPRTRRTDQREKRVAYGRIASLRACLLVDQRRRHVEHYWRAAASDAWQVTEHVGSGVVALPAPLQGELTLDEIYADTDVPHRPIRRLRERPREGYRATPPTPAASVEGDAPG